VTTPIGIKICGITRLDDALAAAALGVDALGFVLWAASPRATTAAAIGPIVDALPPFVTTVGVFVDPSADDVARARDAGLQVAQVHGVIPALPTGMRLLPAVSLGGGPGTVNPAVPGAGAVLVDAHDPVRRGGTGQIVDWSRVRLVSALRPVILAGGLTPENVGTAIREARPTAVDVSSGVERVPGLKDHDKLAAFVAAVRAEA
jgi:phosphoribosylanthranilate isomerase